MRYICPIFLFFIIVHAVTALAQGGYQPGYIVTLKKDTIVGLVKDRKEGSHVMYKKVKFKAQHASGKKFGPSEISGYGKGEKDFESLWFRQSWERLREYFESKPSVGKQVFLQRAAHGYLNLYYLEQLDSESNTVDYIPLFKRSHEDYFVRVTQRILGLKKKRLEEYFFDCPELVEQINSGSIKSLVAIARFYNEWKSNSAQDLTP